MLLLVFIKTFCEKILYMHTQPRIIALSFIYAYQCIEFPSTYDIYGTISDFETKNNHLLGTERS